MAGGHSPHILAAATNDKGVLQRAIEASKPEQGEADWEAAFALASGAVQGAMESTIVVISDGGLPIGLPPIASNVRFVPIGQETGTENLAITALAARQGTKGPELFINIWKIDPSFKKICSFLIDCCSQKS